MRCSSPVGAALLLRLSELVRCSCSSFAIRARDSEYVRAAHCIDSKVLGSTKAEGQSRVGGVGFRSQLWKQLMVLLKVKTRSQWRGPWPWPGRSCLSNLEVHAERAGAWRVAQNKVYANVEIAYAYLGLAAPIAPSCNILEMRYE